MMSFGQFRPHSLNPDRTDSQCVLAGASSIVPHIEALSLRLAIMPKPRYVKQGVENIRGSMLLLLLVQFSPYVFACSLSTTVT